MRSEFCNLSAGHIRPMPRTNTALFPYSLGSKHHFRASPHLQDTLAGMQQQGCLIILHAGCKSTLGLSMYFAATKTGRESSCTTSLAQRRWNCILGIESSSRIAKPVSFNRTRSTLCRHHTGSSVMISFLSLISNPIMRNVSVAVGLCL